MIGYESLDQMSEFSFTFRTIDKGPSNRGIRIAFQDELVVRLSSGSFLNVSDYINWCLEVYEEDGRIWYCC